MLLQAIVRRQAIDIKTRICRATILKRWINIVNVNYSYHSIPYLTHIATTSHLTSSQGPWIPQTPDSQQESDLQEQWREGDEENEEEDE